MKTRFVATGLVLALACGGAAEPPLDASSMGYRLTVPENWIALSREEIQENPDLFEDLTLENVDQKLLDTVRAGILGGKTDFYLRRHDDSVEFVENINVFKQIQSLPASQGELDEVCAALPRELSAMFRREISVYQCKFTTLAGRKALFLEFDGAVQNTRTLQYQVSRSKSVVLIISGAFKVATLDTLRSEFDAIMNTFEFES